MLLELLVPSPSGVPQHSSVCTVVMPHVPVMLAAIALKEAPPVTGIGVPEHGELLDPLKRQVALAALVPS